MARASVWKGWQSFSGTSRQGPTARIRPPSTASARERWSRISWLTGATPFDSSTLTRGAIVGRALSLGHGPHDAAAAAAGLAAPLIYVQALAKITRRAVRAQIVAQGRAACAYRLAQHRTHTTH